MKKFLLLLPLTLFLISGCATTPKVINTLKRNPNLTISEAEQVLGKPTEIHPTRDPNVIQYLYGNPQDNPKILMERLYKDDSVSVFFVDGKLYKYGLSSAIFNLNTYFELGLISKEDYKWSYGQIKQEEYQIATLQAQQNAAAVSALIGMSAQMQQQSSYQSKPIYQPTPIQPYQSTIQPYSYSPPKQYIIKPKINVLPTNDNFLQPGTQLNPYVIKEE